VPDEASDETPPLSRQAITGCTAEPMPGGTMPPDQEPRYTQDELFDRYFDFLKDEQARLKKRGICTWEHEELLLRFFAYVKNTTFITVKKASEERKMQELFGEPMKGDLFKETS
jgi:hypothetical protein